jgi:hypothetical protein
MKPGRISAPGTCFDLLFAGVIVTTGLVHPQQAHDVMDEQTLRKQAAATPSFKAQLSKKAKPLKNQAPAIQSSLWRNSIIISDGEKFTLVPVGSILHLPANLRPRIIAKPQGDFTFWPSFLKRNQTWLGAKEVSLSLSRGNVREADALQKSLVGNPRLLIATYKGGPITILEPAPASTGLTSKSP